MFLTRSNGPGLTNDGLGGQGPGGWQPARPTDRAAILLAREFEAPVAILGGETPSWLAGVGASPSEWPDPAEAAASLPAPGRMEVSLWSPRAEGRVIWLVLPMAKRLGPGVTAWVGFARDASRPRSPWGEPCPSRALLAWGRDVLERTPAEPGMRPFLSTSGSQQSVSAPSQSTLQPRSTLARRLKLSEGLIWRLRVSDPPERFQHLAAKALRDALRVEAVAWVPYARREPVILVRAGDGPPAERYRALLPASAEERLRCVNEPGDPRLEGVPGVRRLMSVAAGLESSAGWLIAINPAPDRPFDDADAELIEPVASLIFTQRVNSRHYAELKELLFGVIRSLTSAIDAKDPYTLGHSERVGRIAVQLGESLGLPANERGDLYLMGLLHDVGKIGIEDAILKKAGPLNNAEFDLIKSHVRIGVQILSDLKKLHHLLPGVRHHHENYDGSGYPSGLSGDHIPLPARILAVADAYDAMSSSRPYRDRLSNDQIERNFRSGIGKQWDPAVVDALFDRRDAIERIRQKGLGDSVQAAVDDTLGRS